MNMGESSKFTNPELKKLKFLNLHDAYKNSNFKSKWLIVFR